MKSPTAKKNAMFRPADIVLAIVLIAAGLAMSVFLAFGKDDGQRLTVTADGKLYGTYALDEDQTVTVRQGEDINIFEIKGGRVRMLRANCHGQDCVQEGAISKTGETIVCLPHKLVLEVTGGEEEFDVVSK